MEKLRRQGLIWVLLCAGISILWGTALARNGGAWIDFRAIYAGTRCLIHHHNPYSVSDLEREYLSEDGQRPRPTPLNLQSITLYVNLPTTFVLVAPFAALPWWPACFLWMLLTGCVFTLAIVLMWSAGASYSPRLATLLACTLAINCETVFVGGNTAGIVVGLCAIAVWCFLENRFVRAGVLCLALSLAIKPHDAGFVWLYFVFAGGSYRKRALQSLAITAAIGLVAAFWVSHVAPPWLHDWGANLSAISARGGINEPGPNALRDGSIYSIVDLQGLVALFRDSPRFYNITTYLICGVFLLVWALRSLRTRFTISRAWLALPAATAFSLLITYHRLWDAKLVMLVIPACCLLWARGGPLAKAAMVITSIAILLTGELSLVIFGMITGNLGGGAHGILEQAFTVVSMRPASIALFAAGVFYLWVYLKRSPAQQGSGMPTEREVEPVASPS